MNILLVEDGHEMAAALTEYLVGHGHSVTWLRNAEDAKHILSTSGSSWRSQFDVAVLDWDLGDGHGSEIYPLLHNATQACFFTGTTMTAKQWVDDQGLSVPVIGKEDPVELFVWIEGVRS